MIKHSSLFLVLFCGIILQATAQCINTFPYSEDFESSNGGWVASAIVPTFSTANSWTWDDPTNPIINMAASGSKCWITGNNPFVLPPNVPYSYNANEYSQIISPCFDFSNLLNPGIRMNIWWETEYSVDGAALQSSIDGGNSWQIVGAHNDQVAWYNDNTVTGGITGPGGQFEAWTGTASTGTGSNGWIEAQHALDGLGGQPNVLLRFVFSSDAAVVLDGFAFDDIFIAERPNMELGADTVVCFADTVILSGCINGITSYSWSSNPLIDTLCTKVVVSSGDYILTATDTLGFILVDTVNVVVSETNVILPPDQLICPGDSIILDADNPTALSHTWYPGGTAGQFLTVSETGTYTVEVVDGFGCLEIDSISVFVEFVPDVDLGEDTTVCSGESIILNAGSANPGTTYAWTPFTATTQTIFVSSPGEFIVVVTTGAGCITSDTIIVDVSLDPVVDLGPDRTECGNFTLNAGNQGSGFLWSTQDTTQTITTNQGGLYWATVVNQFGCSTVDSVHITPALEPNVDLGSDDVICNGVGIPLDAGAGGSSYLWSTSETSQAIVANSPGTYTVQVTNAQNCVGTDTVKISFSTLHVDLGDDITICETDSILLDGGNTAEVYDWSTGETTQSIWGFGNQDYTVIVSDSTGCMITDQIFISEQTNFSAQIDVSGDTVLYGQVQFTDQSTGNPTMWQWDFGDGSTSSDPNPTHNYQSIGTFIVCLTVSDGICTNQICEEVFIDIFDGIEEFLGLELAVYPNPNSGSFTVDAQLPSAKEISIDLFDLAGKKVFMQEIGKIQSVSVPIHQPQLSRGMYLLRVSVDEYEVFRKISID
ncbi:MAG: PKD domain-containing protein [Bacteroidota bacterium]